MEIPQANSYAWDVNTQNFVKEMEAKHNQMPPSIFDSLPQPKRRFWRRRKWRLIDLFYIF